MVDGPAVDDQVADRGRPLVGHHHRVAPPEHRRHHGDGRDDPGDRDVPVEKAQLAGGPQHLGVERALGSDDGQPGHRGRALDGTEAVAPGVDDEQGAGREPAADRLDGDDRVDPAAEGDQGSGGGRVVDDHRVGPAVGSLDLQPGQVEAVAVGELAQALDVEGAQEGPFGGGGHRVAQVDDGRGRSLVVRDAEEQKDQPGRRPGGRAGPVPLGPEGHALGEVPLADRVPTGQPAQPGVDLVAVIAEPVGGRRGVGHWGLSRGARAGPMLRGPTRGPGHAGPDGRCRQGPSRARRAKRPQGRCWRS